MNQSSNKDDIQDTPGDSEKISQKKKRKNNKNRKDSSSSSEKSNEKTSPKKTNNVIKDLIAEHFVLLTLIGKGAFGQIYLSFNTREGIEVAIKKEIKRPLKGAQLKIEAKIYSSLLNINSPDISGVKALSQEEIIGVPTFYGMGELMDSYYLIMEFLGPNMIELLNYCGTRKFTYSCVCLIALQIINRIENVHKSHYIHRDIKPENFLIGTQEKSNIIYLIDFGLSKRYKNSKNHQHIPYREGRPLTGTARYVSVNTHLGIDQSRRDDLESIGYVFVFLLKGSLPWQGLKVGNDKYARIMEKKLQIPTEILCYGLPEEISYYLNYCKNLRFEDRPDYDYLRGLFIKLLGTCNTEYGLTRDLLRFDWCFEDPHNSIWLIYSKNKKGNNNEEMSNRANETKNNNYGKSNSTQNLAIQSKKLKLNVLTPNENKLIKQLSNIDEGQNENHNLNEKTNENNPDQEFSSNSSSNVLKNSNSKGKESENSENTLKEEFQGFSRLDTSKKELIDLINGEIVEDIDKYINVLIQGNKSTKQIQNNDGNNCNDNDSNHTLVVGGRNKIKLKDSLDMGGELKSVKSKTNFEKESKAINDKGNNNNKDDDDDDEITNNALLLKNTMRNSKLLTQDDVTKIAATHFQTQQNSNHKKEGKIQFKELNNDKEKEESKKEDSSSSKSRKSNNSNSNSNSKSNSRSNSRSKSNRTNQTKKSKENIKVKNKKEDKPVINYEIQVNVPSQNLNIQKVGSIRKSFESQINKKLSNPELRERRKSKILEISLMEQNQQGQDVKLSKENIIKISKELLLDYYSIAKDIGKGSYGQVKAVFHKQLGEKRAMKIVNKKSESSQNEIDILRKISHPNIVNVFEIYEDSKKYYIMTELLEGGELFDAILSKGTFSEGNASKIMKQLLSAVNYLHCTKIVHRDLKPENIMLTSQPDDNANKFEIKIIDFGTAKHFESHKKLNKFIGTSYYIAPEVLKENYDEKCDIWSCGVILYILFCGYPPFNGSSNMDIYYKIQNNLPLFIGEEWENATSESIDLIKSMLNKNPSKRLSAEACLNHKWFQLFDDDNNRNQSQVYMNKNHQMDVITKMADFVTQNRFKQAVLQFISTQFNLKKEEENLKELFKQLDINRKGQISKEVFCKQLVDLYGENDGKDLCNTIFGHLDLDRSGQISYNEFLSSMIDGKKVVTEDRLEKAFKLFDKNKDGRLSIDEIMNVFGGDEKSWKAVIKDIDLNNDGGIDLKEFKAMMLNMDKNIIFGDKIYKSVDNH